MLFFFNYFVDPCGKSYILEGVSFEQHEEFQITLCLCVQFSIILHNFDTFFHIFS